MTKLVLLPIIIRMLIFVIFIIVPFPDNWEVKVGIRAVDIKTYILIGLFKIMFLYYVVMTLILVLNG